MKKNFHGEMQKTTSFIPQPYLPLPAQHDEGKIAFWKIFQARRTFACLACGLILNYGRYKRFHAFFPSLLKSTLLLETKLIVSKLRRTVQLTDTYTFFNEYECDHACHSISVGVHALNKRRYFEKCWQTNRCWSPL